MTLEVNTYYFSLSDEQFLPRALSMADSFRQHNPASRLVIYCLDDISEIQKSAFRRIDVDLISLHTTLGNEFLEDLKAHRSLLEFVWTLPSLLLNNLVTGNHDYSYFVYLDADIYFYSSLQGILDELPKDSISVVEHRFSKRLGLAFPHSGRFNVSWVGIPNTKLGLECAKKWSNQCLELCPDVPIVIDGKVIYGDQKYLDDWPDMFRDKLFIINNKGFGLAPWNYENYTITNDIPIQVDNQNLIFFHFSSHQYGFFAASKMGELYRTKNFPVMIYKLYEDSLSKSTKELKMKNWKSRHRPFHKRLFEMLKRRVLLTQKIGILKMDSR